MPGKINMKKTKTGGNNEETLDSFTISGLDHGLRYARMCGGCKGQRKLHHPGLL
jgi:hypothetical protein